MRSVAALVLVALWLGACGGDDASTTDDPVTARCPRGQIAETEVVGLTVKHAWGPALEQGCSVRVVEEDGESLPITLDIDESRLNVIVENGTVAGIDGVY